MKPFLCYDPARPKGGIALMILLAATVTGALQAVPDGTKAKEAEDARALRAEARMLKAELEEAKRLLRFREMQAGATVVEERATTVQAGIDQRRTEAARNEKGLERTARKARDDRLTYIRRNLLLPGYGDIKRGQNYGWFWMGGMAGVALAGADSYRNMRSAEASMNRAAAWDPVGLQQKQVAYHRAYAKNEAIWGIFLTLYLLNGIGSLFPTFSSPPVASADHQGSPAVANTAVNTTDPNLFEAGFNTPASLHGPNDRDPIRLSLRVHFTF